MNNAVQPISQDSQMLTLIKKRKSSTEESIKAYEQADRLDLVESTRAESSILTELSDLIPQMTDAELEAHVAKAVSIVNSGPSPSPNPNPGSIFKTLFGNEGLIKDATVDKKKVNDILKKLTEKKIVCPPALYR